MNEPDAGDDLEPDDDSLCAGVVTISSSRSLEGDEAGEAIGVALEENGSEIAVREHVSADYDRVQSIVSRLVDRDDVEVVITAGATGVEPTDITIEAVDPLMEKELTAFSDLFTVLAYEQFGTAVVAARTLAGISEETPIFCLPGHPDTVRLALEEIVLSEAAAIVDLAREDKSAAEDETDAADEEGAETDATTDADATDGGR